MSAMSTVATAFVGLAMAREDAKCVLFRPPAFEMPETVQEYPPTGGGFSAAALLAPKPRIVKILRRKSVTDAFLCSVLIRDSFLEWLRS